MTCPNEHCGGLVYEYIDDRGGGSRYCLDGCGYYEELPEFTFPHSRRRLDPSPPLKRRKLNGRDR